jgi:hypothetical protein
MRDRTTVIVACVALAAGYWLATSSSSPVGPPASDRPVLRFLARAAKGLLWIALVAEQPPETAENTYVVHATVGPDGAPTLNHARGW